MSYWSRVDFWPKNDSLIGLESDFLAKNDSRIGLESDFLAKNDSRIGQIFLPTILDIGVLLV